MQNNKIRHLMRIIIALAISLVVNEYHSFTQEGWMMFGTLVVMLTATGSALYQGLLRFFILLVVVLVISPMELIVERLSDVTLGSIIGIVINLLILPDRVDLEFRKLAINVLQSYAKYFSGIVELVLLRDDKDAERGKIQVEQRLQQLPGWVYETGFDKTLQKGYRYYLMKLNQVSEILFAMHYTARTPMDEALLAKINEPLLLCVTHVNEFVQALATVLDLKKLTEGVVDFSDEIEQIDMEFKKHSPFALELLDVEKESMHFAEFIFSLKEFHDALVKLAKALR